MLMSSLHVTVNRPDTSDCHHVIEEAMKKWLHVQTKNKDC